MTDKLDVQINLLGIDRGVLENILRTARQHSTVQFVQTSTEGDLAGHVVAEFAYPVEVEGVGQFRSIAGAFVYLNISMCHLKAFTDELISNGRAVIIDLPEMSCASQPYGAKAISVPRYTFIWRSEKKRRSHP